MSNQITSDRRGDIPMTKNELHPSIIELSGPVSRRAALGFGAGAALALTAAPAFANITSSFTAFKADGAVVVDHSAWDAVLKAHIKPDGKGLNMFDYAAAKKDALGAIKAYVKSLEAIDPATLNRNEQFAFWANLYNAKTIEVVLGAYPIDSIRKISLESGLFSFIKKSTGLAGPWKTKIMKVKGQDLSLDDVEHEIMRKIFKDPRIHYSVNCASIGCPNLGLSAFTGANLETELDAGARAFINHARGIDVDASGSVTASSIYNWFKVDFGGTDEAVIAHAIKYATPEKAAKLKGKTSISSFQYDWALNDVS